MPHKFFTILLILIFAGLFGYIAWQPIENLMANFILDDTFYYLKISSNLAKGFGPTFDGEHLTNGYHPLWMGILTAIHYFFPEDKVLPIKIALGFSVLFYFLTALAIWKIISVFTKEKPIQYILVLAYALNPWNLSNHLNGLETSLMLFLFSLFFWLFLKILYGEDRPRNFVFLGLLAGLLVLSRVDCGLFAASVALFFLLKKKYFSWKKLFLFVLPAIFVAGPWFLYNKFYFGSFIPTSGLAYTQINHRLFFYKSRSLITIILWSIYNFFGTIAFTLKTIGLPVFYSILAPWRSFFWMCGIFAPLVAASAYFRFRRREAWKLFLNSVYSSKEWIALVVFFLPYLALVAVHGGIRWSGRQWYFAVFSILIMIFVAIIISRNSVYSYRKKILIGLAILLSISYGLYFKAIFPPNINGVDVYRMALYIRDTFPSTARIASFNSGIIGYFSDRFVMNSDGMVNQAAYEAMKENRLWELFQEERIDYIVDYEIVLTYRYKSFLGIDNPLERIKKIDIPITDMPLGDYAGSRLRIYSL